MTTRVYLRLLRPFWSLPWALVYAAGISRFSILLFHSGERIANWMALTGLVPFLWGMTVATAAHAPMHRPFFRLLPDGLSRMRRATLWTLALSVLLLSVGTRLIFDAPWFAGCGLMAAAMTFPLINPHTPKTVIPGLLPIPAMVATAVPLWNVVHVHPLLTGVIGWLLAATFVWWAFLPAGVARRADIPFNSAGPTFFALLNLSSARRFVQETIVARSRCGGGGASSSRPLPGFDGSGWSWVRMIWHSSGGKVPYPYNQALLAAFFGLEIALFPLLRFAANDPFDWADYWDVLAALGSMTPYEGLTNRTVPLVGICLAAQGLFIAVMVLLPPSPRVILPLSRRDLSRVMFALTLWHGFVSIACVGMATAALALVAQAITGKWQVLAGLGALATVVFGLLPFLPVAALTRVIASPWLRILAAAAVGTVAVTVATLRFGWQPYLLTPAGVLLQVAATAAALMLLRAGIARHYRRCDLLQDIRSANPLATAVGA